MTWTDPSHCGPSFPGYRLPLLSPSLLPPGTPRSLGFHNTRAHLSLYVLSPARAQRSHVSTRSLLPWQSALHWAFLSPFLSPGHSQEQRHLWDPADKGLAAAKQGSWGQGKGYRGKLHATCSARNLSFEASSIIMLAWAPVGVLGARVSDFILGHSFSNTCWARIKK